MKIDRIATAAFVGAMLSISLSPAKANDACFRYIGQTVAPQAFDKVASRFASLRPKNEFETTAQYRARMDSAIGDNAGPIIIAVPIARRMDAFVYDADRQVLQTKSALFGDKFDAWSAFFYASGGKDSDTANTSENANIEVTVSKKDQVLGTYMASNAFGAKIRVTKVFRSTKGVFDHKSDVMENDPFESDTIGEIPLSPRDGLNYKMTARAALVIESKDPYLSKGVGKTGDTTIDNPYDITEDFTVLIADIECALMLDAKNKVLAAYRGRSSPPDQPSKTDEPTTETRTPMSCTRAQMNQARIASQNGYTGGPKCD